MEEDRMEEDMDMDEVEALMEGEEEINTLEAFHESGEYISAWFSPVREQ
jgi:hypothetical protein